MTGAASGVSDAAAAADVAASAVDVAASAVDASVDVAAADDVASADVAAAYAGVVSSSAPVGLPCKQWHQQLHFEAFSFTFSKTFFKYLFCDVDQVCESLHLRPALFYRCKYLDLHRITKCFRKQITPALLLLLLLPSVRSRLPTKVASALQTCLLTRKTGRKFERGFRRPQRCHQKLRTRKSAEFL